MNEIDTPEEMDFRKLMSVSKLEVPFSDFEDEVMALIEKKASQPVFSLESKLSWIFFIAGSVFGVLITFLIPRMKGLIFGMTSDQLALLFLMVFVTLFFVQLDNLLKCMKKSRFR